MYTDTMIAVLFLLGEIVLLFFVSQQLTKTLSRFFLQITKQYHSTIQLLAVLFLPGVIVHELSHLIVANILFVRTGEIEFLPQVQGDTVKLGSVAIAKTDPLRRFLIGVAPLLMGGGVLITAFYFLSPFFPAWNWQTVLLFYMSFEIGNTMFSSKKDMEGSLILFIVTAFFAVALWFLGLRISLSILTTILTTPLAMEVIQKIAIVLFVPLFVDIVFLLLLAALLARSKSK